MIMHSHPAAIETACKNGSTGASNASGKAVTMSDDFEDHCWKDVISPEVMQLYSKYQRKTFVGPAPALVAIDLYEAVYQGGNKPMAELRKTNPGSYCVNSFDSHDAT